MAKKLTFAELAAADPSWKTALNIVRTHLEVQSTLPRLVRAAWQGPLDPRECIRMLGFSRINLHCLLDAAELKAENGAPDAALVEQALNNLGVRLSAVVCGINTACARILKAKPPALWRQLFQEMMTRIEIGYRIGTRVGNLGLEGGALMGFAPYAGLGVLLVHNPKAFKQWYQSAQRSSSQGTKSFPKDVFGCEPFQVTSFVLQQLGFGHEVAIGAALGGGKLPSHPAEFTPRILAWKAALLWVEALHLGRDYPAEGVVRSLFPELAPPKDGSPRNPVLEVLYTEIARLRSDGSKWTWHLPKPSYDETAVAFSLP